MKKLGEYQDNIESLASVPITRYERALKLHRGIKNGREFLYYNILDKIVFPEDINEEYLGLYTAQSAEPLTTASFRVYGDIDSWWLLYLANKEVLGNAFFIPGGTQLKYILPEFRDLIYESITRATIFDNRHF